MKTPELQRLVFRTNSTDSGVRLLLEPLVDSGTSVPIAILLKSPSGLSIESFEVFAPENPITRVLQLTFNNAFGKPQTQYQLETRIRLGLAQDVWVVAKLSDGTLMGTHQPTVLTSSACFDATD
jgi:predicted secreted protein